MALIFLALSLVSFICFPFQSILELLPPVLPKADMEARSLFRSFQPPPAPDRGLALTHPSSPTCRLQAYNGQGSLGVGQRGLLNSVWLGPCLGPGSVDRMSFLKKKDKEMDTNPLPVAPV